MKDALLNRVVLVMLTALASSAGTWLVAAQPVLHAAFCGGQ